MIKKVIEMKKITKIFSGTVANNNINFDLYKGETHVLLGENGAGKTTLMSILYGLHQPTSGKIYVNENEVRITSPNEAIKLGIGMVHQHFMLIPSFTVLENIILGKEPTKGLNINLKEAETKVSKICDKYGFKINLRSLVEQISVGQQQKVEIIKALYRGADILILDEPTAVLTPQEIKELENIIENLKEQGKSIILITHKLKEIMSMSDRVTIIRRGEVVKNILTKNTSVEELAELMVGRKVNLQVEKQLISYGDKVIKVKSLNLYDNRKIKIVDNVSFDVKEGEIFGVAGVDGNGQNDLIEAIVGLQRANSGSILFKDKEILGLSTEKIMKMGIGYIPEDRHKRGLILPYSLCENSIMGIHKNKPFSNGIVMNYKNIENYCKDIINEFDVRTPSIESPAYSLSGGNQQKLIIAREITKNPKLIIASQPTRGIDIGAIEYIHKRLVQERDKGKAVILVSLELDEILALSDRIAVMYDGKIVDILDRKEANENKLGILMAGGSLDKDIKEVTSYNGK